MTETYRTSDDCKITAERNGHTIGEIETITYLKENDAVMGTVSFAECIADPRGCDVIIQRYTEAGPLRNVFYGVNLGSNLYLETPIMFLTDHFSEVQEV